MQLHKVSCRIPHIMVELLRSSMCDACFALLEVSQTPNWTWSAASPSQHTSSQPSKALMHCFGSKESRT